MQLNWKTLRFIVPALTCVIIVAWAHAEQRKSSERAPKIAEVGKPAPNFTLKDCNGEEHTLADLGDKIVVLEWVNQQCPWSVKAVPVVKKLHEKYADNDKVVFLGVESTHWRTPEENLKYFKEKGLKYAVLMDNDGKVGRRYNARTTPHMFVIDRGTLVYAGALHNDQHGRKSKDDVRNYVDETLTAVLAGKKVPVSETKPWGCSVKYKK